MICEKLTKSDQPHLETLKKYKYIFDNYKKTGEVTNLFPHIRAEIVDAYRAEFPHYNYNGSCYECVVEMLTVIYKWYETTHKNIY